MPTGSIPKNSTLAADKKELLARLFLEKAEASKIKIDKTTKQTAETIFDWLYEKFEL